MTHATSQRPSRYPLISVSGSIRLGQFLKLAGLVEDGAEARIAIQSGDNPKVIRERLLASLAQKQQKKLLAKAGAAGGDAGGGDK